ncbi:MAG TPA: NADH-quinone oxidoreductase subunit J [Verrucomicrobiota bacterium]|jgi:NADH-quinone oxidoreductase subunit J|nr:NADH-quinone oxidoreductase subunit J [Verrucomicrobiota bacterium]HOA60539.1 NADH-quinone oxidoreductase subunit J [Verrucomicrobiota bacterium]HOF48242.1 NADH-quinone oxidoreductase subunit J [Verrucomicrobiota bacterium]HOG86580.1 NADH-quinone oxidoreductase subunit J [Verrucomicrobiota bacterium]HOR71355.1 NADH-quinone oxidoreductase subunit J [Verrucomicrobiota bacterium]
MHRSNAASSAGLRKPAGSGSIASQQTAALQGMQDILFYVFAALTLVCGFLVVANPISRSPVTSALFLVLTIVSLSGLFVLLHAFFLAAVQIVVYAGAALVLFLFVIMMLDLKAEERRRITRLGLIGGGLVAVAMAWLFRVVPREAALVASGPAHVEGSTPALGALLFTQYLLPFEAISLVLVAGMVGAILLSRKEPS